MWFNSNEKCLKPNKNKMVASSTAVNIPASVEAQRSKRHSSHVLKNEYSDSNVQSKKETAVKITCYGPNCTQPLQTNASKENKRGLSARAWKTTPLTGQTR